MKRKHKPARTPKWVRDLMKKLPPVRWAALDVSQPGIYGASHVGVGKMIVWYPSRRDRSYDVVDYTVSYS